MLPAPASPRAEMKRIAPRCAKASRIGMLWMEITPNAAFTPHCSRKAATTAPPVTVDCISVLTGFFVGRREGFNLGVGSCMAGMASGDVDVGTRRVGREGRSEEKNGARGLDRK